MLKRFICLLFLLLPYSAISSTQLAYVSEILEQVSESDREDLDHFFRLLIQNHEMGYTLFGSKPITVYNFFKFSYSYPCIQQCVIFEKGWAAWLRNKHLFQSEKFVFKKEERKGITTFIELYLINKKCVFEQISKHLDLFKESLGENISPEEILERICSDKPIHNILSSQLLLGIFYGYGENNARAFEQENEIFKTLCCKMFPPFSSEKETSSFLCPEAQKMIQSMRCRPQYVLPKTKTLLSEPGFNQVIESRKRFDLVSGDSILNKFGSPRFIYWDDQETNMLRDSYSQTRTVLKDVYSNGSFLENTLYQWMTGNEY